MSRNERKLVCIVQARTGSTRLPGKVLMPLAQRPVLWHVVQRISRSSSVNQIVVATTNLSRDDRIVEHCSQFGFLFYRGDEQDVLSRYWEAARWSQATDIIRVTSDCPLIEPQIVDKLVSLYFSGGFDYASNVWPTRTFAHGHDVEIFSFKSLEVVQAEAREASEREHVTPFYRKIPLQFKIGSLESDIDHSDLRIVLDTPEDYQQLSAIYQEKYKENELISFPEVLDFFTKKDFAKNAQAQKLR